MAKRQELIDQLYGARLIGTRTRNALWLAGLRRVADIRVLSDRELLKVKNFGAGSLAELRQVVPFRYAPSAAAAVRSRLVRRTDGTIYWVNLE